jgi:prophage regulatory protein
MDHWMETHTEPNMPNNHQPLHAAQLKDALLNVKTVMAQTGLSRSAIHKKVKDGTMPAPIKLSARCVRWHSEAIQQWVQTLAISAQ